jgi:glycosyltransferase involved in cell wall biosynthesis
MRVSVICTVLNEGEAIRRLMDSLVAQTRQPDEVIIVDGGSRDNTAAVIREYASDSGTSRLPVRVLAEPGANISRGRNVAIEAATGDLIASVDAGVWLVPCWLELLVAPLEAAADSHQPSAINDQPVAVSGFFVPDPRTPLEVAMGATVLPAIEEVKPDRFLPSSRSVAFTKSAWEAVSGYPEWLDYCEDLIFDFRLLALAGSFAWAPGAVAHFRPRSTLRALFKQYYRYARGDGKADLWRARHLIRYVTYLVLLPGFLALAVIQHPFWLLALLAGIFAYCRTPYRRLRAYLPSLSTGDRLRAALLVPVIRVVGDVAKMSGYPMGWLWRLRHWANPEIHWRRPSTSG